MRRADRLFQIVQILRGAKRPVTAGQLADELELSRRTLYRDIADLMASGVPLRGEAGVGYVLEAGYDLPPLMLTVTELEAAILGAQWVVGRGDPSLARAARDLVAKLQAVAPADLLPGAVGPSVLAPNLGPAQPPGVDLQRVREAIHGRRKLIIDYSDELGRTTTRTIWPITIAYLERVRMVIAWCELRGGFRHFRADRIASLTESPDRFVPSPAVLRRQWAAEDQTRGRRAAATSGGPMPDQATYPGVYVQEPPSGPQPIAGVSTTITAFVGRAVAGPTNAPTACAGFADFERRFGAGSVDYPMSAAVEAYFLNGGREAIILRLEAAGGGGGPLQPADYIGDESARTGLWALEGADLFNLLCLPWDQRGVELDRSVQAAAAGYCVRRRAMYVVDGPSGWIEPLRQGHLDLIDPAGPDSGLGIVDEAAQRNTLVYFPKVTQDDGAVGVAVFPACGAIAGRIVETDLTRGVWKAAAGAEATLTGVVGLEFNLTSDQQPALNALGINTLRQIPAQAPLIWGARTLRGSDQADDDYKYAPIRRLTLFIEESLDRGTRWAALEPNAETLWAALRLDIEAFMEGLKRQGAFYDYRVICDGTTTTAADVDNGICTAMVMFAPLRPAEFLVLGVQMRAGPVGPR